MSDSAENQHDTCTPEEAGVGVQPVRISVDGLGALEHQEVARHVTEDEAGENEARKGHDELLPD